MFCHDTSNHIKDPSTLSTLSCQTVGKTTTGVAIMNRGENGGEQPKLTVPSMSIQGDSYLDEGKIDRQEAYKGGGGG